jgi:transposase
MERSPRGIYATGFSAEAAKLVETAGFSVTRVTKQLSMPKSSLDNWVRAPRAGKFSEVGKGQRLPTERGYKLVRTLKELEDVKMECNLL